MRATIRLAIAAALVLFAVGLTFLPMPAAALPCQVSNCYSVSGDYEGMGPADCCTYACSSGTIQVCHLVDQAPRSRAITGTRP
jgi:hypothetical protein